MFAIIFSVARSLGIVATLFTIFWCALQATHLRRVRASGVSRGGWLLLLMVSELWVAYGILFHVTAEALANVPIGLLAGVVLILIARDQHSFARTLLEGLALSILAGAVIVGGIEINLRQVVPTVAVGGALFLYFPQLLKVIKEADLSGVSLPSVILGLLSSASWGAYGLMIHQVPVYLPSVILVPSAIFIISRVVASAHRHVDEQSWQAGCASDLGE